MTKPDYVYVTYVAASPESVWEAITSPEFTCQYWHQSRVESDFVKGSAIKFYVAGSVAVQGEIIVANPPTKLSYTWQFVGRPDFEGEKASRVMFEIEPIVQGSKLTVIHDQFATESNAYQVVSEGWPLIIAGLKTLLETDGAVDFTNKQRGD